VTGVELTVVGLILVSLIALVGKAFIPTKNGKNGKGNPGNPGNFTQLERDHATIISQLETLIDEVRETNRRIGDG